MTNKRLIVFSDSGDTVVDESTQTFDERGIVTGAQLIPGAGEVLRRIHEEGFPLVMVVDGETESFRNVYRQHDLGQYVDAWVISEEVGQQKPAPVMFETAYRKMGLTEADRSRIVMVGNNLKKDIAGANRQGLTSVWLDWSPRYFHTFEEPDWIPDYTVKTPAELIPLLHALEDKLNGEHNLQNGH